MAGRAPREENTENAEENVMKLRCIYCQLTFECEALPEKCPHCTATLSLTITPDTQVFEIVRAAAKNDVEVTFNLRPREEGDPSWPE